MDLELTGRHALVCGASEGIGRAAAHELALLGADVTLLARRAEVLEAVAAALPRTAAGQRHGWIAADVSQHDDTRRAGAGAGQRQPGAYPGQQHRRSAGRPRHRRRCRRLPRRIPQAPARQPDAGAGGVARHAGRAMGAHRQRDLHLGEGTHRQPWRLQQHPRRGGQLGQDPVARTGRWTASPSTTCLPGYTRTQRLEQILDDRSASTGKTRDAVAATMLSTVPVGRFAEAGRDRRGHRLPGQPCGRLHQWRQPGGGWRADAVDLTGVRHGIGTKALVQSPHA